MNVACVQGSTSVTESQSTPSDETSSETTEMSFTAINNSQNFNSAKLEPILPNPPQILQYTNANSILNLTGSNSAQSFIFIVHNPLSVISQTNPQLFTPLNSQIIQSTSISSTCQLIAPATSKIKQNQTTSSWVLSTISSSKDRISCNQLESSPTNVSQNSLDPAAIPNLNNLLFKRGSEESQFIEKSLPSNRINGIRRRRIMRPELAVNSRLHLIANKATLSDTKLDYNSSGSENEMLIVSEESEIEDKEPVNKADASMLCTTSSSSGRYECKICNERFLSNHGLQRHDVLVHGITMVMCFECNKMFRTEHSLQDHKRRVHGERKFTCIECGMNFNSEAYLKAHGKIHASRQHTCTQCNHAFVNKTDLNNHMRVHTGEKPFKCTVCGKSFRHVSGFYTHVRIHTGENPYKCEFCDKLFTNASNFQSHRKTHTKEKRFKCKECGREFIQQSNFSRHLRIHTQERPYQCIHCEMNFTYSTALKRHQEKIHGQKPLPCENCNRTYLTEAALVRHRTGCEMRDCVKEVNLNSFQQETIS